MHQPSDSLGVYKRLSDVPPEDRLGGFQSAYEGRDVWREYLEATDRVGNEKYERAGRFWKDHMADLRRHHALADPVHVESYVEWLYEGRTTQTVYTYFYRVRRFYEWLLWHTDHPHKYNPITIAAASGGDTRRAWEHWATRNMEK